MLLYSLIIVKKLRKLGSSKAYRVANCIWPVACFQPTQRNLQCLIRCAPGIVRSTDKPIDEGQRPLCCDGGIKHQVIDGRFFIMTSVLQVSFKRDYIFKGSPHLSQLSKQKKWSGNCPISDNSMSDDRRITCHVQRPARYLQGLTNLPDDGIMHRKIETP